MNLISIEEIHIIWRTYFYILESYWISQTQPASATATTRCSNSHKAKISFKKAKTLSISTFATIQWKYFDTTWCKSLIQKLLIFSQIRLKFSKRSMTVKIKKIMHKIRKTTVMMLGFAVRNLINLAKHVTKLLSGFFWKRLRLVLDKTRQKSQML